MNTIPCSAPHHVVDACVCPLMCACHPVYVNEPRTRVESAVFTNSDGRFLFQAVR